MITECHVIDISANRIFTFTKFGYGQEFSSIIGTYFVKRPFTKREKYTIITVK